MGIDLNDVKPSTRTLTGFNGSSEVIAGTIRLSVHACGVTRTVKFSVVSSKAPYHVILGTPWLHSMRAIASTYHQCVKFPGSDGSIKTLKGDQQAARDLLIATVKIQRSQSLVNSVSPPTSKVCPQKEEVLEVPVDESDPSKSVRVGAFLPDEMQQKILEFLKQNLSTFAWTMSDMKGIDPAITTHELNVDPNFKPIRQKRRKLGPERSKAVAEEVERLLGAGSITEILMHPDDREKTAFITDRGTYCYKVMPFGLKNAGATYQRLVNRMFAEQLGKTMEVYIDDMLVKSLRADDHLAHLKECFAILNKYGMKLNPAKCTFGVSSGEFLGYIVTQRGIEANPKQISAVLNLPSPRNCREVQRLTGRIAALNRFISRSTDKCLPFYDLLRGNKKFIGMINARTPAKSQVLADFLVELTPDLAQDLDVPSPNWILHVDGSSTSKGSGAGVQLQSPTGELIRQSFSFGFPASNNEAEYESLIAGLRLARAVKAKRLSAYCDSQLVASQFSGDYDARNDRMDAYLRVVQELAREFDFFELTKVPRGENVCADALAALGSKLHDQVKRTIPIHRIDRPSIDSSSDESSPIAPIFATTRRSTTDQTDAEMPDRDDTPVDWRTEFLDYLVREELPKDKWAARRLKRRSAHYVIMNDELHRVTANKVLLKCIQGDEVRRVMAETHDGAGGNHSGGRALALKVRSLGFFWPSMNTDCEAYARR
ncbi:uncharacterized protein LOC130512491 [Raphanus sativus]|uniref:Uncharacterized protein LOC130512491 n=1 Tax=Raphanus sativus TaxID=3726 RepID=A0A9W3DSC3_RAPSA|nr:uncharacterized protein LOC130512491 [Raphanus sativus]